VIIGGWALAQRGQVEEGVVRIKRGIEALQQQDAFLRHPYYLALLAESYLLFGKPEAARAALDVAQTIAQQNGDLWYLPELHRLRGLTEAAPAEACFRRALGIAREQGSRSLELRAATSLAGYLRENGRSEEAAVLLEPVQAFFPERLDTHDLRVARALLDSLS
jgi:predicted ATPase